MAISIVEELWARIRAVIDDKIVAAEDAAVRAETVADAFGSLEGVVDQVQAAEGYAQAALEEADRSSSEADRAEAAAQSASTGVQTDTVGRLHLTPALRGEIDGKAAASHQHSWSDVTDKPSTYPPESHSHTATQISDATATGRSVLTAASQDAARTAIGAGTSSLALGTTASTAKAGNYQPTAANISDATTVGRNVLKATDAAAARSAIGAGTSNLALGSTSGTAAPGNHTHSQYAESSRVTALEGSQPIIVSSLPASPLPGRIYLVTG